MAQPAEEGEEVPAAAAAALELDQVGVPVGRVPIGRVGRAGHRVRAENEARGGASAVAEARELELDLAELVVDRLSRQCVRYPAVDLKRRHAGAEVRALDRMRTPWKNGRLGDTSAAGAGSRAGSGDIHGIHLRGAGLQLWRVHHEAGGIAEALAVAGLLERRGRSEQRRLVAEQRPSIHPGIHPNRAVPRLAVGVARVELCRRHCLPEVESSRAILLVVLFQGAHSCFTENRLAPLKNKGKAESRQFFSDSRSFLEEGFHKPCARAP